MDNPQPEADLEEMKKEMSQLTAKMAQIKAYLMGENAKLEADLVDRGERNRELEKKISETLKKNEDLEAQLRARNMEARDGKAMIGELDGKINALQSKISGFETQMNGTRQELVKTRGKISGLEREIAKERNEAKDKDVEMSRLTAKMAQIEANLMGKIAETKRKNDDLEAQLRTQNTEVRDGKAKIGELEEKINALQSKNFGLETQLDRTMTFLDLDGWSYLVKTASWYKAIDQRMTFDEAVAYCASRKIHLVSIHSQEEHDFVLKLANTVNSSAFFWIGLKRNPNEGNAFEWTDGSSLDFTNWRSGEQDSYTHALLRSPDGKWQVWSPTYQARFICKRSSQF